MNRIFGNGHVKVSDAQMSLRFPAAAEVETYWQALRARHYVPRRADLDPRGILSALSKAFILECSDPEDPRFRIVGSDITDLFQGDLRGRLLTDLIAADRRTSVQEIVQDVCRLPALVQMELSVATISGDQLELRMILLPMKDASGQIGRILGCLDFDAAGYLPNVSAHGLVPRGSIARPLGAERHGIERPLKDRGLTLVSSEDRPRLRTKPCRNLPDLRLVER